MGYHFRDIESKWQTYWKENSTYKTENNSNKKKYYVLDMFPYPSGAGLHVGHPLGYIASDVYARYKRHQGFNVLHPQGYDSFGLPAEQYAIQTGQHPSITTQENITRYRSQLDRIGFSFDWDKEVRTSNPDYYKWTQWIFIELYESWFDKNLNKARPISELKKHFSEKGTTALDAQYDADSEHFTAQQWNDKTALEKEQTLAQYRLAYLADTEVNWCPELGTVLANDEVINGLSERGGHTVIRKKMTQWSMRISAYAERLLEGLDTLDWTNAIKDTQRNWIGKSIGANVRFELENPNNEAQYIEVFTTRPDTIFGVGFLTLAPEHPYVTELTTATQKEAIESYIEQTSKRSERERMADVKTQTGVFTGSYAIHPISNKLVPIWISDYVLMGYGTGAVMAVPCGDQRDWDFANHFKGKKGMPDILNIFKDKDVTQAAFSNKEGFVLENSDFINGKDYKQASQEIIKYLEKHQKGEAQINYRLRDAVFSRQRYWGEPFPVYYKDGIPQMIAKEHLPIELPNIDKYLPTETGEPPLGRAENWAWDNINNKIVANKLIDHQNIFPLELNTMPGWAGSSWYLFRYMDNKNNNALASKEALDYWKNVDLYIGGSEHATGHLLYSRFWTKFLYDRGHIGVDEPFQKMINQGMILGESAIMYRCVDHPNQYVSRGLKDQYNTMPIRVAVDFVNQHDELDTSKINQWQVQFKDATFINEGNGVFKVDRETEKMSKSKYNVVNPDEICQEYGADTLRLYEMFLGPLEQAKPWSTKGISGVHNFLKKLWKLYHSNDNNSIQTTNEPLEKIPQSAKTLHKTIQKVTQDIENFSFNTSVSTFMIAVNELTAQKCTSKSVLEPLLVLIAPYAPHIAEELWQKLGNQNSITEANFPKYEAKYTTESSKKYPISFNGKTKFMLEFDVKDSKEHIQNEVINHEKTIKILEGKTPKKIIIVPNKIVNIVV